jgi:hypothetical protein
LKDIAVDLQREIQRSGGKIDAKWVQMNLSLAPDSHKLHVDKTVENWVKPAVPVKKASLLNEPDNRDYGLFQQAYAGVREQDRKLGRTSDQFSEQLAACLAVEAKAACMKDIHHVVFNRDGTRAFAIDTPNINAEWRQIAYVDTGPAGQQTLTASSEKMAQVNDTRLQQTQQAMQQRDPEDPNRSGPRMA